MITVDRIDGDRAVLNIGGELVEVPAAALPAGASEGAVLRWVVDPTAARAILDEGEARLERLRRRGPSTPDTTDL